MSETEVKPPAPVYGPPHWPWAGVVVSLLVPGFGLLRANKVARGFTWFIALQGLGTVVAMLAVSSWAPNALVYGAIAVCLLAQLAMLVDSYRPGRLTSGGWVIFLSFLAAVVYLPSAANLVAKTVYSPGLSMSPTLLGESKDGPDNILVNRMSYMLKTPKRGDLLVFRTNGIRTLQPDQKYIKRVIGLPGEKIQIRDGHVYADGKMLTEKDGVPAFTYTLPEPTSPNVFAKSDTFEVPYNAYFVIGDNPANSFDSRYFGGVPIENVYGKAVRIFWPLSRAGVLQ